MVDEILFEKTTIEEARAIKRQVKKSGIIQAYEKLILDLKPGEAYTIDASKQKEKPQTIKNRIIRIAKSHNMLDLAIQRRGDKISIWLDTNKGKKQNELLGKSGKKYAQRKS